MLVSEVMLQQTPVVRVEPAWRAWMARWPTPADLAAASTADVLRAWDRLGYPRRALRLQECARAIVERHGGVVPADEPSLRALPGVGSYTAAAVLAFAYGRRSVVLDTNVRRVLARTVDGVALPAPSQTVGEVRQATRYVPDDDATAARWAAASMELGALVCTARSPRCDACPVRDVCAWYAAGRPADELARPPEGPDVRGHRPAGARPRHGPAARRPRTGPRRGGRRRLAGRPAARPLRRRAARRRPADPGAGRERRRPTHLPAAVLTAWDPGGVLTSVDVLNQKFAPTKFREGYDQDEVDDFLDRVAETLKEREGVGQARKPVTAQQIEGIRFQSTKWREGYDQQEVDHFLDRVRVQLTAAAEPSDVQPYGARHPSMPLRSPRAVRSPRPRWSCACRRPARPDRSVRPTW